MSFERRIAFTVFAVGVLLVLVALAGCGGTEAEPSTSSEDADRPETSSMAEADMVAPKPCKDLDRATSEEALEDCLDQAPDLQGAPLCEKSHAPVQVDGVTVLPGEKAVRVDWADSSSVFACRIEVTDTSDHSSASSDGIAVRMRVGSLGNASTLDLRPRCSYAKVDLDLTPQTEVLLSGDGVDEADQAPEPDSETTEGCQRVRTAAVKGYIPLMP